MGYLKISGAKGGTGGGGGGATDFTDLGDVPASYTGESGKALRVNVGETGIEFYTPVTTDERVKVSSNDTTAKYLEDAIVVSHGSNASTVLERSTLNDGGNEDVQIQFDVSKVDHGSIAGLADDDHTQYHNDTRADTWLGTKDTTDLAEGTNLYFTNERAQDAVGGLFNDSVSIDFTYTDEPIPSITASVLPAGVDHNSLNNLATGDVHTQYALLTGRSGGQTLIGDTLTNGNLLLQSNSGVTPGYVGVLSGHDFKIGSWFNASDSLERIDIGNVWIEGINNNISTSSGDLILDSFTDRVSIFAVIDHLFASSPASSLGIVPGAAGFNYDLEFNGANITDTSVIGELHYFNIDIPDDGFDIDSNSFAGQVGVVYGMVQGGSGTIDQTNNIVFTTETIDTGGIITSARGIMSLPTAANNGVIGTYNSFVVNSDIDSATSGALTNLYGLTAEQLTDGPTNFTFVHLPDATITPSGDFYFLRNDDASAESYHAGNFELAGTVNISGLTASRALALDASKNVITSATTDTELGYLSGVTSSIQTQLGTKQDVQPVQTLTDGANISWDLSLGHGSVTLAGARTLDAPTNQVAGKTYILKVANDATGGRSLSFASTYKFTDSIDPTISTGANAVDVYYFWSDGTNMYGTPIGFNLG